VIPERSYHGKTIACDMDDTTMLMIDFDNTLYAFIYATVAGGVTQGFQPNLYGTAGAIIGTKLGDEELKLPGDHQPHVTGPHTQLRESHVFEDVMQLVDWVREDKASIVTPEHARHVIDIIEAGYHAAETGETQALRTSFEPLQL
jgi:predicted dehydrogenase